MKIVIVEDSPEMAAVLRMILSADGSEVLEWTDHFDAITHGVDWRSVDVVVVDQLLGIYDGKQLLRWLEKEYPHIRRIMLTGDARVDIDQAAAHIVLIKPASPSVIQEAVHGIE